MTYSRTTADEVCQAFAAGARLDLAGAEVPAVLLVGLLVGTPLHAEGRIPALRLAGAAIRGRLELPGATVPALVELTGCTFDEPIDLYAAELTGWRLARCALPGLQAANLRMRSELTLENCTVTGPVMLPDARIEGPLRLLGTRLETAGGHALVGVRLMISGVLDARELHADDEIRLSGARIDGNIDLRGARLAHPGGDALEASGAQIGGNLRCDRGFTAHPGLHRRPARRTTGTAGRLNQAVARCPGRHDRQGHLRQPRVHRHRGRAAQPRRSVEVGELRRRPARWTR
ncbi:MAG: hypothetical protein ACRDTH_28835 [Pseudonocardiaceae bacterium]